MGNWKNTPSNETADKVDIAIIGAGPQALTLVTHLLQKKESMGNRFIVLDPTGDWLQQWQHQFAAYGIPHLRSPIVHHPDPDPHALRAFAESRSSELFPPYDLPGTQLFHDFCQEVIRRWGLQDRVIPVRVEQIERFHEYGWQRFRLRLSNGRVLTAKRVVVAIAGGQPNIPKWVQSVPSNAPSDRLLHSDRVDLRTLGQLTGETILIIGSGLTSGHLALGAIARGAKVIMMARRVFYEKLFDAEPGWLGPKYLKGFHAETDWETRWQMIQTARNGGSLTPAILTQLRRKERQRQLSFYEQCEVQSAAWQEEAWKVSCNQSGVHHCIARQRIDRIWLATGSTLDVNRWPLLANIRAIDPLPLVNGLPVLDEHLRWAGCNLFVMGGAAALQLGPVARNLFGARLASRRIVPALIKNFSRRSQGLWR
ncbi:FAD/NAD(P)-binding protein [Roseofilum casamattae]|uniref:L-lysine N6-monooxygenase MbtG n=1 Tax=Roseofilum casamattae BLCC-M143 TaxID=3022442 RepID=A0ABT7C329_9CYAN|nr:FAD/NAD(P)-binding protein [Roseofilum casamattae]MDJ1185861.1 FAD/NAD(P)-binding protein [Roseofilum casamattae BLCC-M143]